ncbi:hypothetical protein [Bacillus coahuilensis]|uniref:hypothetical protein n=1 Tax=Bacillus coahuilensis TaxID=408580 RepID=UPI0001850919|nr:hypothetical protein [Bacillus coahuilensis]
MKNQHILRRVLFFIGTWLSSIGIAFWIVDSVPEPFSTLSMPLLISGSALLIASNFFKKEKK